MYQVTKCDGFISAHAINNALLKFDDVLSYIPAKQIEDVMKDSLISFADQCCFKSEKWFNLKFM